MVWPVLEKFRRERKPQDSIASEGSDPEEELPQSTASFIGHLQESNKKPSLNPIVQGFSCTACHDLITDSVAGVGDGVIKTKLGHLKSSAKSGCAPCKAIRQAFKHFRAADNLVGWQDHWRLHSEMPGDSESAFAARGEDYIPRSNTKHMWIDAGDLDVEIHVGPADPFLAVENRVVVVLQGTRIDWETHKRSHPIQLYTWIPSPSPPKGIGVDQDNRLQQPLAPLPLFGPSYDVPRRSDDPHCLQTARGWLEDCLSTHPDCHGKRGLAKPQLPNRVLDISAQRVRILEGAAIEADYVTLSYCWGNPETQRLKTTKSNLDWHRHGIDWNDLCKTHQDAITMTRALGFSYLWVSKEPLLPYQYSHLSEL